jgi:molybdopterin/thiamine biosynthesis adenylyltransferase
MDIPTLFSYSEAFSRNRGLISQEEQLRLASSRVVIAGCGGVGGCHAHTLARLGIGKFRLCDPDSYSVGNFNRQFGAMMNTINQNKAKVTADIIKSINPEAEVEYWEQGVDKNNVQAFLSGADLVVDGIDFFTIDARRTLFSAARVSGIPAMTAAPLGFSGTLHVFMPGGMSFDQYFDISDDQEYLDKIVHFIIGLAPRALHINYMDLRNVDPSTGRGPSSVIGVQQAACLLGAQAVNILLDRGGVPVAPRFIQFDAYRQKLANGRIRRGNKSILQRLKKHLLLRKLNEIGLTESFLRLSNG